MKVRDVMTKALVSVNAEESVSVAARALQSHNIGALPVCNNRGELCGMVTDRDLVIRCLAANREPEKTKVREVMTQRVISAQPDMDIGVAAHMMGREQIRRLPVVESGRVCGMVSLGDIASREETVYDAGDALFDISSNLSKRD